MKRRDIVILDSLGSHKGFEVRAAIRHGGDAAVSAVLVGVGGIYRLFGRGFRDSLLRG